LSQTIERLLKTEKKNLVIKAIGDGKIALSALGIDQPSTLLADQLLKVRATGKTLYILRRRWDNDPVDDDAYVTQTISPHKSTIGCRCL
jgi:hypothetical protein